MRRMNLALLGIVVLTGCGDDSGAGTDGGTVEDGGVTPPRDGASPDADVSTDGGPAPGPTTVEVRLVPEGATTRVSFAIPLAPGVLRDEARVRVRDPGGAELPAARLGLATHGDGSLRSVLVQIERSPAAEETLAVEIGGEAGASGPALESVESTLDPATGLPRVWALLPAAHLAASGVAGPLVPSASIDTSSPLAAWDRLCDYDDGSFSTETFLSMQSSRAVWLYDRGTVFFRGHARRGDLGTLRSAYAETELYRAGITGDDASTRIGIPEGADSDPKYNYVQNLAIHYLMTGDVRFRDRAEDVAQRMLDLWPSPEYGGGDDFWTERASGFALLAYVWAARVTDEPALAATLRAAADVAVDAYLAVQATYPAGYDDPDARCFAHHGDAHDASEGNPYFGCSPWMSAILADALDAYGEDADATRRTAVSASLAELARIVARDGIEPSTGRPYYWMGVGTSMDAPDDYDEHRGEAAYVVALGWHHDGRTDDALRASALSIAEGFDESGEVGQLRSFNWQCRTAVMTPTFLR